MKISNLKDIDPDSITNIVFDWGGVIVNIDYYATITAFRKLGLEDFKSFYSQKTQNDFFIRFEIGKVTTDQFRDYIRKELNQNLTNDEINDAWCAMILDIPKSRIETLLRLKSKYRILLLSNTNQLHEEQILPRLKKELGFDFLSLFDRYYLSHHIGMRKPNADIYEHVLADAGIEKSGTLFIDDTEINIDTAASLGIKACYLQPDSDIVELFQDW
jgi:putative hydrolase of the HAD superfamily